MIEIVHGSEDIILGRLGEHETRTIKFPVATILVDLPGCEFIIVNKRPGDLSGYPVNNQYIKLQDKWLWWTIQSGDVSKVGKGQCEVIAMLDGRITKSRIWNTSILPSLDGSDTPPEPWESWVNEVTEKATTASEASASAIQSAREVQEMLATIKTLTPSLISGDRYKIIYE